jgi:putative ABC transport system substrate-binding protein
MVAKTFDLIRELFPKARRVAVLWNPTNEMARIMFAKEGPSSAERIGVQLQMVEARDPAGIAPAIEKAARDGADVLYVPGDPLFHTPAERVPEIANRVKLPSVFLLGQVVRAGGLMSFGSDQNLIFRGAAGQVDKLLRGAKPADLPVQQPDTYELVINLTTAERLGVSVPQSLLLRAQPVR